MCQINSYTLIGSNRKTEVLAGITTFLTMAYIAFVNPRVLQDAGMDQGSVFTAMCLITAFACAATGLIANTPIGAAPGMVTIMMIPFTASIADGIGGGIMLYTLLKLFTRQRINPLVFILSLVFIIFFLIS